MSPHEVLMVLIVSVAPFVEVRGSVPLAYVLEPANPSARAALLAAALAGNLIIAPAVMPLLDKLEAYLLSKRDSPVIGPLARLYDWAINGVRSRIPEYVRKYGHLGLALFVAVPIPGSGAWSGTLIAHILGIKGVRAIVAIEAGVLVAFVIIVSLLEGVTLLVPLPSS